MSGSLLEISTQLSDLARLVQSLCSDATYEQAYLSEQHKLQQSVAAYKALEDEKERLARENAYCRDQLLPSYDKVLCLQAQANKDWEARNQELETESRELAETYKQTRELSRMQAQKVEELEANIQILFDAQPRHPPQSLDTRKRLRPTRPAGVQCEGASAKRVTRHRLSKTT